MRHEIQIDALSLLKTCTGTEVCPEINTLSILKFNRSTEIHSSGDRYICTSNWFNIFLVGKKGFFWAISIFCLLRQCPDLITRDKHCSLVLICCVLAGTLYFHTNNDLYKWSSFTFQHVFHKTHNEKFPSYWKLLRAAWSNSPLSARISF